MAETPALPEGPLISRRLLLGGFVAAYTASLIPWALAQPAADPDMANFMALSALIVGGRALDATLAQRLYAAFLDIDPNFKASSKTLLDTIEERKLDAQNLQKTLDDEKSPLAPLPHDLARAWFQGIVGSGDKARCVAFETALNAMIVADVLKPPTYAYGAYGSWASKPV